MAWADAVQNISREAMNTARVAENSAINNVTPPRKTQQPTQQQNNNSDFNYPTYTIDNGNKSFSNYREYSGTPEQVTFTGWNDIQPDKKSHRDGYKGLFNNKRVDTSTATINGKPVSISRGDDRYDQQSGKWVPTWKVDNEWDRREIENMYRDQGYTFDKQGNIIPDYSTKSVENNIITPEQYNENHGVNAFENGAFTEEGYRAAINDRRGDDWYTSISNRWIKDNLEDLESVFGEGSVIDEQGNIDPTFEARFNSFDVPYDVDFNGDAYNNYEDYMNALTDYYNGYSAAITPGQDLWFRRAYDLQYNPKYAYDPRDSVGSVVSKTFGQDYGYTDSDMYDWLFDNTDWQNDIGGFDRQKYLDFISPYSYADFLHGDMSDVDYRKNLYQTSPGGMESIAAYGASNMLPFGFNPIIDDESELYTSIYGPYDVNNAARQWWESNPIWLNEDPYGFNYTDGDAIDARKNMDYAMDYMMYDSGMMPDYERLLESNALPDGYTASQYVPTLTPTLEDLWYLEQNNPYYYIRQQQEEE